MLQNRKQTIIFLISLLAVLAVIVSLTGRNAARLSGVVMALSLGVTLYFIIQANRARYTGDRPYFLRGTLLDVGGLFLSTAAAVLAGLGVVKLAQNWLDLAVWWGALLCLGLSFAVGLGAASLVRVGWNSIKTKALN
jgi:hypothetical protein